MADKYARAGLSPALVETVAGLSAGSIATLVVHPLDIVKTRMQLYNRSSTPTVSSLTSFGLMRGLTQTPQPWGALYRGLTPNLLGNASSWASFFFFKVRIEGAMLALKRKRGAEADKSALSPTDYFVASGLAGVGVQIMTNPIWVLKTRMLSSDRSAAGAYPSMWTGAVRLWRAEGWRGFYRGLGISLLGVSHGAVQFAVYEPAKRFYFARRQRQEHAAAGLAAAEETERAGGRQGEGPPAAKMTTQATLVLSSASKLAAGAVTYPYQVIRSRLQNYDADERFGRGIGAVVRKTWAVEGWRGFYRGIVPGVVRVLPATWVTFLVYENVKYHLPQQQAR